MATAEMSQSDKSSDETATAAASVMKTLDAPLAEAPLISTLLPTIGGGPK
jgi:hypothetical protein